MDKTYQEHTKKLLNDFAWTQLVHDRDFHADIFVLNTHSTLKHFTLHQAKYLSRIFNPMTNDINMIALTDMFIILTATQTATKGTLAELFEQVKLPAGHIQDNYNLMMLLIGGVSLSAKVCEGLDHVEKQDYHANLRHALSEIAEAIWQLCNWGEDTTKHISIELLVAMAKARLLQVELGHPQFIELKRGDLDEHRWGYWYNVNLNSPAIDFTRSVSNNRHHQVREGVSEEINNLLLSPFKLYAIKKGYVTQAADGSVSSELLKG